MARLLVAAAAVIVLGAVAVAAGTQPRPAPAPARPAQIVHTITGDQAEYAELHRRISTWRACRDTPSTEWPCGTGGAS